MNVPSPQSTLIDNSRAYPCDAQRAAAWRAAFADDAGPFRGAFEHAAIGMAIIDLDGRFLKVNRALTQIVGYDEDELLQLDFQRITHPDDLKPDLALTSQLIRGEIDHFHLEKRYFHKQGHVVWILLSASIVRDAEGRAYYAISQIQDISARKSADHQAQRQLRHVNRLTQTVKALLRALADSPSQVMLAAVLKVVMDAFDCRTGVVLRLDDKLHLKDGNFAERELAGELIGRFGAREVHGLSLDRCDLWTQAWSEGAVLIENTPRTLSCGLRWHRSLVGPIFYEGAALGLFHIADGPLSFDVDDRDLLFRITAIMAPVIHARMERDKLTPREAEIMDLIVAGMSQKQIATALSISVQTAAKHRSRVLEKLKLGGDVELVHLAMQMRMPWTEAEAAEHAMPAIPELTLLQESPSA
jgi:PAS domain S-box-containing protein